MDYELAKQLKEAGFPLSMKGFDDYCRQVYMPDVESIERHEKDYAYEPTLSELIEACGKKIKGLQTFIKGKIYGWIAISEDVPPCFGSTPEEAVAKLWLELNKK